MLVFDLDLDRATVLLVVGLGTGHGQARGTRVGLILGILSLLVSQATDSGLAVSPWGVASGGIRGEQS